jgi:hypothetical protein
MLYGGGGGGGGCRMDTLLFTMLVGINLSKESAASLSMEQM